jgi:mono/diheme cytochrome c family protein
MHPTRRGCPLSFGAAEAYGGTNITIKGGIQMKRAASFGLLSIALWPSVASAQQPVDSLNDTQKMGRQVFAQSCGVCHLPPALGARTYGPALNKDAGGGDNDVMREFIENGTPRMPAFKYYLKPAQIDSIISYVRTVPVQAAAATPARRPAGGGE